jgi:uncharacterized paraquat-inducible protein A
MTNLDATQLPFRELWNRLNQDYTQVIVKKLYPSINNYCQECGELYDDGKAYKCPTCNTKTHKKFTVKFESVPNYIYKHTTLTRFYTDSKKRLVIYFQV